MKKLFVATVAACLFAWLPIGCTEQEQLIADGAEEYCTINLDVSKNLEVNTRIISSSDINEVWVVQLNSAGTAALVPPVHVKSVGSDNKIKVNLKRQESTVYLLANTNNNALFDVDAELSTFTTALVTGKKIDGSSADWGPSFSYIPMYGTLQGTPGNTAQVEMTRVFAFLSIQVKKGTNSLFVLESLTLKNVPPHSQIAPTASVPYPAATGAYLNYAVRSPGLNNTHQFYVVENCRGIGHGRYETEKTADGVANGNYAMYYEVKGKYSGLPVVYSFYLGENNKNDYNVRRNTQYTVVITISGANEADARLKITATKISAASGSSTSYGDAGSETVTGSI